jgi:hypothetical protein
MNLQHMIQPASDPAPLLDQIRRSPAAAIILDHLRSTAPDLPGSTSDIPQTTYTRYRQFAVTGDRARFEEPYFARRAMLTRAVVEMVLGDAGMAHVIHDLLWSICEETSWVLPAHEDLGEGFEALNAAAAWPVGSSTSLTREPDFIDLFAAETGASLAETVFLLGDGLAPEVVQRVRQEIERRVFRPYLAYGRKFWWHRGDMNWNAVCNGAVGLAFMRLEKDTRRLAEALVMVLEGFEAYLATGFEMDGGSLEGISYWNYGLLYYVTLAELLREQTAGQLDLLTTPRMRDIARFPLAMALSPGRYLNYGDATEQAGLQPGILQRLAERTGLHELKGLLTPPDNQAASRAASLAIILRDIAWWNEQPQTFPAAAYRDFYLPACAVIKLTGRTVQGRRVALTAKAGCNTGHHYHLDIGHFTVHVDGGSLLCDPGRGLYTREYFRDQRFQNVFCSSFGHSVPRIGGRQQRPGPTFGGGELAKGEIIQHKMDGTEKLVVIDFAALYGLPELAVARRRLRLMAETGEIWLDDAFEFSGDPLEIEEAFVTWNHVTVSGSAARIVGQHSELSLVIQEPMGVAFNATLLTEDCRANHREDTLTRLTVSLPAGTRRFVVKMTPSSRLAA